MLVSFEQRLVASRTLNWSLLGQCTRTFESLQNFYLFIFPQTERLLKMTLEERRKEYLREYVALKDIPTWMEEMRSKNESDGK